MWKHRVNQGGRTYVMPLFLCFAVGQNILLGCNAPERRSALAVTAEEIGAAEDAFRFYPGNLPIPLQPGVAQDYAGHLVYHYRDSTGAEHWGTYPIVKETEVQRVRAGRQNVKGSVTQGAAEELGLTGKVGGSGGAGKDKLISFEMNTIDAFEVQRGAAVDVPEQLKDWLPQSPSDLIQVFYCKKAYTMDVEKKFFVQSYRNGNLWVIPLEGAFNSTSEVNIESDGEYVLILESGAECIYPNRGNDEPSIDMIID